MSVGWSAGDIASTIQFCCKITKALKESCGSAAKYQNAATVVEGVEILLKVSKHWSRRGLDLL
jgi:hypothetical protein